MEATKQVFKAVPLGRMLVCPYSVVLANGTSEQIAFQVTVKLTNDRSKQQEQFFLYCVVKPLFYAELAEFDSFAQLKITALQQIATENKFNPPGETVQTGDFEGDFLKQYVQENKIQNQQLLMPTDESFLNANETSVKVYRRHEDKSRVVTACRLGLQNLVTSELFITG